MSKQELGHADSFKAFEFEKTLWLTAKGRNPTTGWRNWFETNRVANEFSFLQQPPDGPAGQVVLPFTVINAFISTGTTDVLIHEMEDGKSVVKNIPVEKHLCPVEEHMFAALTPTYVNAFLSSSERVAGTSARYHLGSFDIPFGCASWQHPTRSKRVNLYLEVDVAGPQDVEGAIVDCLKQSAIGTALVVLLTPVGWASGPGVFAQLIQACLAGKLRNILRVQVQVETACN